MLFTLEQKLYKTKNGQMYSEIIVKDEKGTIVGIKRENYTTKYSDVSRICNIEITCKLGESAEIVETDIPEFGIKQIVKARLVNEVYTSLAEDSDSNNTGDPIPEKEKAT